MLLWPIFHKYFQNGYYVYSLFADPLRVLAAKKIEIVCDLVVVAGPGLWQQSSRVLILEQKKKTLWKTFHSWVECTVTKGTLFSFW